MREHMAKVDEELVEFNTTDLRKKFDNFQRKIIKGAFTELYTPIDKSLKVEINQMKKALDEVVKLAKAHSKNQS